MSESIRNKAATFNYEIIDEFEAGLVLTGPEVKSLRGKHVSFKGSYLTIDHGEAWVKNLHIPRYHYDSAPANEFRPRKLLLRSKEIIKLEQALKTPGQTGVPLSIYLKNNCFKMKIGIGRGRKKHDKRQVLKERSMDKRARQTIKNWK